MGRTTKPPPLPARAPIAPVPAKTDVLPAQMDPAEEISEVTKNLEAPDAGQLVEKMLELVASEAEALLSGEDREGRLADLNVRTALATWDGLHEQDEEEPRLRGQCAHVEVAHWLTRSRAPGGGPRRSGVYARRPRKATPPRGRLSAARSGGW